MRELIASTESAVSQAEALFEQGRFDEALIYYRELAAQTHVVDYEYDDWLRRLAKILQRLNRHKEAG